MWSIHGANNGKPLSLCHHVHTTCLAWLWQSLSRTRIRIFARRGTQVTHTGPEVHKQVVQNCHIRRRRWPRDWSSTSKMIGEGVFDGFSNKLQCVGGFCRQNVFGCRSGIWGYTKCYSTSRYTSSVITASAKKMSQIILSPSLNVHFRATSGQLSVDVRVLRAPHMLMLCRSTSSDR